MASVKPFFRSNFLFFVQFMAFTFAADTTSTKANTHYSNALERTAPITESKNEKAAKAFFSEKWKTLHAEEDEADNLIAYAGVRYRSDSFSKAEALLNVWQPYVAISDGISSFSQVEVVFDVGSRSLKAGWMVNGHGEKPIFFVYAVVSDNSNKSKNCFNLECGAFTLPKDTPNIVNGILEPVSTYGVEQYEINITINQEVRDNTKVWAVYCQGSIQGYYAESLFGEAPVASSVNFAGGVAFRMNGLQSSHSGSEMGSGHLSSVDTSYSGTEMGSGHFPGEGYTKAAFIRHMQVYTGNNVPVSNAQIVPFASFPQCYDVVFNQTRNPGWGSYIYYGGPGGRADGCSY